MNLGKNILNLLINQKTVYVKGLGAFNRVYISSSFDEKNKVYLPPITYIEFDGEETEGSDFARYLQHTLRISYSEAEELIEKVVEELKRKLKDEDSYQMDGLGYLIPYGEKYVFKPLDLSGFNFEPVSDPFEEQIVEEESATEVQAMAPLLEREKEPDESLEPMVDETVDDDQNEIGGSLYAANEDEIEERPSSSNNNIWYIIAAACAIGVILFLVYSNYVPANENANIVASTPPDSDTSTEESFLIDVDSLEQERILDSLEALVPADTVAVPAHTYQIVIGSHKTLEQAHDQAEVFHKKGYKTVKVIPSAMPHNRKKVIWDSYATKVEADSALRFVKKHHVKDAWPDKIK